MDSNSQSIFFETALTADKDVGLLLKLLSQNDMGKVRQVACIDNVIQWIPGLIINHRKIVELLNKDVSPLIPRQKNSFENFIATLAILFDGYVKYSWKGDKNSIKCTENYFKGLAILLRSATNHIDVVSKQDTKCPKDQLYLKLALIFLVILSYTRRMEITGMNLVDMDQRYKHENQLHITHIVSNMCPAIIADFLTAIYPSASKAVCSSQYNILFKGLKCSFPIDSFEALKKEAIEFGIDITQDTLDACVKEPSLNTHSSLPKKIQTCIAQFEAIARSMTGELLEDEVASQEIKKFVDLLKEATLLKSDLDTDRFYPIKASHQLNRVRSQHQGIFSYFPGQQAFLIWRSVQTDENTMRYLELLETDHTNKGIRTGKDIQRLISNLVDRRFEEIAPAALKLFIKRVYEDLVRLKRNGPFLELILISELSFKDQIFLMQPENNDYFQLLCSNSVHASLFLFSEGAEVDGLSLDEFESKLMRFKTHQLGAHSDVLVRSMLQTVLGGINSQDIRVAGAPSLVTTALKVLAREVLKNSNQPVTQVSSLSIRSAHSG